MYQELTRPKSLPRDRLVALSPGTGSLPEDRKIPPLSPQTGFASEQFVEVSDGVKTCRVVDGGEGGFDDVCK